MYTLFLVLRQGSEVKRISAKLTVRSNIRLSNTGIYQEKLTVRSKIGYQFCISKCGIRSKIELSDTCIYQENCQ